MGLSNKLNSFVKSQGKCKLIRDKVRILIQRCIYSFQYQSFGKNSLVESPDRVIGKKYISIGKNVRILHHIRMEAVDRWGDKRFTPAIQIGDNVSIGQNFHVVATDKLIIGANTTISGNVLITDNNHEYEEIGTHVLEQPLKSEKTEVGENCFIGYGAVIQAGTVLGKQCIVGSNAVVRGKFEDYSVLVGVPAKVVKKYNVETEVWEKVNG